MKGYRTIAAMPAFTALAAGIGSVAETDWTSVGQGAALAGPAIVAMLNIGLRLITTTPVGRR
jgi:hypothetical protein